MTNSRNILILSNTLSKWANYVARIFSLIFRKKKQSHQFSRNTEINLADLVLALKHIPASSKQELELIAGLLGFNLSNSGDAFSDHEIYRPNEAAWNRSLLNERPQKEQLELPEFISKPMMPVKPPSQPDLQGNVLLSKMEIDDVDTTDYDQMSQSIEIARPLSLTDSHLLKPVNRQTLFSQKTYRGIISATATQRTPGQDLDLQKLIDVAVRYQPLKTFPVLPRVTTRAGCQLLLDFHEALTPWWDDMHALIHQFEQVLGETQCQIYEFAQTPLEAFRWTEQGKLPWQPISGKPVIIASDIGIMSAPGAPPRAVRSDWVQLIQLCKLANVPLIVLFPLHPQRCPYRLDRLLTLIHWHPATTASIINRLIKQSGRSLR